MFNLSMHQRSSKLVEHSLKLLSAQNLQPSNREVLLKMIDQVVDLPAVAADEGGPTLM